MTIGRHSSHVSMHVSRQSFSQFQFRVADHVEARAVSLPFGVCVCMCVLGAVSVIDAETPLYRVVRVSILYIMVY